MKTPELIGRLLEPVRRRLAGMVFRGVVRRVDSSRKMQALQVDLLAGETLDRVELAEQYGFTSSPNDGAEVFGVCVGGDRGHPLALAASDRRHRPTTLAAGEVLVYSSHGQRVLLKAGGAVEVSGATSVKVNASTSIELEAAGNSVKINAAGVQVQSPGGLAEFR